MAFALSIRNTVSEVRQIFFTTTCLIAIATVIFNGGMTVPILTLLKVKAFRDETIKGVMIMSIILYLQMISCFIYVMSNAKRYHFISDSSRYI